MGLKANDGINGEGEREFKGGKARGKGINRGKDGRERDDAIH